jgi:endonuclease YncB( thermonuclease family)
MGGWAPLIVAGLVAGSVSDACAQTVAPASATACRFESIGTGTVTKILDGRSFQLSDGREVRVAAVEVPSAPGLADTGARAASGRAAIAALETILAGRSVELRQSGLATDRYGRLVAHAYFVRDGAERSAAHELLARGYARVAAKVGHAACAAELLAQERQARAGGLGLWAGSDHAILGAERATDLLSERGRFTVVEGKVLSVRESGGTIYMNFGRRWSEALTVTILKRDERIFAGAGLQPSTLENRRLRVRGYVEERNGPRIEAKAPEQIEIADRN